MTNYGYLFVVFVAVTVSGLPEPPPQAGGWGQQSAAPAPPPPAAQGWGQAPAQAPQAQGWGQAPAPAQNQGWGQQSQAPAQGWGQQSSGTKGGKGLDWEYNFALGYQGEKGQAQGQQGWGQAMPEAMSMSSGGWSSEPETNIKKPSISDIFSAIISFPRELKNILKESGLWILALPLLIIIPLFLFAFSAGKFFGGMDEGWGWDKRSSTSSPKSWLEGEWENMKGFLKDPKVQAAAKGFMDEFVAKRIVDSVDEKVIKDKSS